MPKFPCLADPCIMGGFLEYLINTNSMPQSRAKMCVNKVRKFHNHVGKAYIDIEQSDIQTYLSYLWNNEHLKESTLHSHLAAIKKFYEYLWSRGDACRIPRNGITISYRIKDSTPVKKRFDSSF